MSVTPPESSSRFFIVRLTRDARLTKTRPKSQFPHKIPTFGRTYLFLPPAESQKHSVIVDPRARAFRSPIVGLYPALESAEDLPSYGKYQSKRAGLRSELRFRRVAGFTFVPLKQPDDVLHEGIISCRFVRPHQRFAHISWPLPVSSLLCDSLEKQLKDKLRSIRISAPIKKGRPEARTGQRRGWPQWRSPNASVSAPTSAVSRSWVPTGHVRASMNMNEGLKETRSE
jgi:hypothetical protein